MVCGQRGPKAAGLTGKKQPCSGLVTSRQAPQATSLCRIVTKHVTNRNMVYALPWPVPRDQHRKLHEWTGQNDHSHSNVRQSIPNGILKFIPEDWQSCAKLAFVLVKKIEWQTEHDVLKRLRGSNLTDRIAKASKREGCLGAQLRFCARYWDGEHAEEHNRSCMAMSCVNPCTLQMLDPNTSQV
jgi:hypothetical protein